MLNILPKLILRTNILSFFFRKTNKTIKGSVFSLPKSFRFNSKSFTDLRFVYKSITSHASHRKSLSEIYGKLEKINRFILLKKLDFI